MVVGGKSLLILAMGMSWLLSTPVFAQPAMKHTGHDPARSAICALISSPQSPLPKGTALRDIKVVKGLATVDFSREIQTNFRGGDSREIAIANGILTTLGQFPTIRQVQILVAGKPVESLGGLLLISGPMDTIRPETAQSHLASVKRPQLAKAIRASLP